MRRNNIKKQLNLMDGVEQEPEKKPATWIGFAKNVVGLSGELAVLLDEFTDISLLAKCYYIS
jgi:hypothetical protein